MGHAIIYTTPDCPRCTHAKTALTALGFTVEGRDVDALVTGKFRDTEALVELTLNNGALPVVVVDGRAVRKGDELYSQIEEFKKS